MTVNAISSFFIETPFAVDQKTNKVDYVLTVNVPNFNFPEEEIAFKTWGLNKKIAQVIFNLGFFEDTGKRGLSHENDEKIVEFWKFLDDFDISNIPLMKQ